MKLVIKINSEKSDEPCFLCGEHTAEVSMRGPMLFIEGTDARSCWDCGYKHNPELTNDLAQYHLWRSQERKAAAFNAAAAEAVNSNHQ